MKTKIYPLLRAYKIHFLYLGFVVFGGFNAFGFSVFQEQEIVQTFSEFKGIVVDSKSKAPLSFATLNVSGTNISTVTNSDGEFLLKVPKSMLENAVIISFLGYQVKTVPLASLNGDDIQILLEESAMQLSEVKINVPKDARTLVKAA